MQARKKGFISVLSLIRDPNKQKRFVSTPH